MRRWSIAVFVKFDRHRVLRPAIRGTDRSVRSVKELWSSMIKQSQLGQIFNDWQCWLTNGLGLENGNWHCDHSKAQHFSQLDRRVIPFLRTYVRRRDRAVWYLGVLLGSVDASETWLSYSWLAVEEELIPRAPLNTKNISNLFDLPRTHIWSDHPDIPQQRDGRDVVLNWYGYFLANESKHSIHTVLSDTAMCISVSKHELDQVSVAVLVCRCKFAMFVPSENGRTIDMVQKRSRLFFYWRRCIVSDFGP